MKKLFPLKLKGDRGMTYVELIVVLTIISILISISLYKYQTFQNKIDIKNLANDIALKAVEAQKWAIYGNLPPLAQQGSQISGWNPAYGLYFTRAENNYFYRFTDLNNDKFYQVNDCAGECLEKIRLTKSNLIIGLYAYDFNNNAQSLNDLTVTFTRPSGGASLSSAGQILNVAYAQIDIASSPTGGEFANIKIYASGRIQIN